MEESLGPVLTRIRLVRGWSQLRVAALLCAASGTVTVTRNEVSRWEREERVPSRFWLGWLALVLEVPVEELSLAASRTRRRRPDRGAPLPRAKPPYHGTQCRRSWRWIDRVVPAPPLFGGTAMARTVQVQLLDDIDGNQADETLSFALDGMNYEIDLSTKHAEKLRTTLAKFVEHSRRIGRGHVVSSRRTRTGGAPARTDRAQIQTIRDWAKSKGIESATEGGFPAASSSNAKRKLAADLTFIMFKIDWDGHFAGLRVC